MRRRAHEQQLHQRRQQRSGLKTPAVGQLQLRGAQRELWHQRHQEHQTWVQSAKSRRGRAWQARSNSAMAARLELQLHPRQPIRCRHCLNWRVDACRSVPQSPRSTGTMYASVHHQRKQQHLCPQNESHSRGRHQQRDASHEETAEAGAGSGQRRWVGAGDPAVSSRQGSLAAQASVRRGCGQATVEAAC